MVDLGLAGKYRIEVRNSITDEVKVLDWFDNIITNQGLDVIGNPQLYHMIGYCRVGSGTTAPSVNDVGVETPLGDYTHNPNADQNGVVETPIPYGWTRRTFSWSPGQIVGTVTEVAVGWRSDNGNAFSRALLKVGGVPTSIVVTELDFLTITYELRHYPKLLDIPSSVVINGTAHNLVSRPALINYPQWWSQGFGVQGLVTYLNYIMLNLYTEVGLTAYTDDQSVGLVHQITPVSAELYVPGSYEIIFNFVLGVNVGNSEEGISKMLLGATYTGFGAVQIGITPPITKTINDQLTLALKLSWGRYAP